MTDLEYYLTNISFRFIQPKMPVRAPYSLIKSPSNPLIKTLLRMETLLEYCNTKLPENDKEIKDLLWEICKIPKMSTFAIGAIINRITSQIPDDESFVNVGVWHGFTFLSGIIHNSKKCIGIDNFSQFGGPREEFLKEFVKYRTGNHTFVEMDYEEYFAKTHQETPIGFYIYDGHHSYENQLKGLQIAEPFFSKDCIILIDDTNLPEVEKANLDFITQSSNSYRILLDTKTYCNAHPTYWNGIMIFQKISA